MDPSGLGTRALREHPVATGQRKIPAADGGTQRVQQECKIHEEELGRTSNRQGQRASLSSEPLHPLHRPVQPLGSAGSKKSAEGFKNDEPNYRAGGHPVNSDEVAEYVGTCLAEHEPPLEVFRELDKLQSDVNAWLAYEAASSAVASAEIKTFVNLAAKTSRYEPSKTGSLVEDFPDAFRRHPLRKLDLSESLRTFVRKVFED